MSNGYVIPYEDKLKCSTCQDRLKDARHLPCGHIFCKDCLERGVRASYNHGNISCSECMKTSPLPSGGVDALPKCYVINGLLDEIKQTFHTGNGISLRSEGFQVKEIISCSICLSPLDDARHLPCGHVFCKQCLEKQTQPVPGQVKCCKCTQSFLLPAGGIGALPSCYRINSIVAELSASSSEVGDQCNGQQRFGVPGSNHHTSPPHPRPQSAWSSPAQRFEDVGEAKARANQIQVFVRKHDGRTVTVHICSTDTIATLKQKIKEATGVHPSQQSLSYSGKPLSVSTDTLLSYGIGNNSTINMSGRLRGGTRLA